jgi:DMSO/TMAO reductase YedYZ molybdopterin-dependent catalytic subunit
MDDNKYQTGPPRLPHEIEPEVIISPDTHRAVRVPPGQTRTRKWPVLHYGHVPHVSRDEWTLEIKGLVERPQRFNWDEFLSLPQVKVYADFHCVTTWSRLDNVWEGVSTRTLLELSGVLPAARYVVLHGYDDGWTTNLPLADFLSEDALLAHKHDGEPLSADHGGPVRGIVPQLYAWKSAKWICGIELTEHDQPGYWERGGYHNHGNPWVEERFG